MLPFIAPDCYGPPDRIKLLAQGIDVAHLADCLAGHPELWDQNSGRTAPEESPHHGLSDIWCRFNKPGGHGHEPHFSVWYPAASLLPVRTMARDLMHATGATALGGVLITRIPPHMDVKPHTDTGWHARFYDKFAVQVAAAPGQRYCFKGQALETEPGDLFWFDNAHTHWVENPTDSPRITAIFCLRIDDRREE